MACLQSIAVFASHKCQSCLILARTGPIKAQLADLYVAMEVIRALICPYLWRNLSIESNKWLTLRESSLIVRFAEFVLVLVVVPQSVASG